MRRKAVQVVFCIFLVIMMLIEPSMRISAGGTSPTASFSFWPVVPYVNVTVFFDACRSTAGSGSIISYIWNFGDNTTGTGSTIEKFFTRDGNHFVTLTVTNSLGENDTTTKIITVLPIPIGAAIDLYTQNGGEGYNQPSGVFCPGQMVILSALLTYNGEPVAYKPVAFEIMDASGETTLYRSNFTDTNGIARINFTLYVEPLPRIIGKWTAIAVSSVSEQKVSDTVTLNTAGIFLDIYTQKPKPYSGRGPNACSDAYAPQEEVILYGEAHYDCQPIEFKFVTFVVTDPNGTEIDYRVSPTNMSGIATASFRLASNATFGIYHVFGSVEINGEIANDTLCFRVGWIIENLELLTVNETGAPTSSFARGEHICFNLTAKNIAFTPRNATFTIVAKDVSGVPIGEIILYNLLIEPGVVKFFVISIQIPMWAFTGTASACANAYTDFPIDGGIPYCPEVSTTFTITSA